MKTLIAIAMILSLAIMPLVVNAQPEQAAAKAPPVSQQLVPEGDFALQLATTLKLGAPKTETEAEDLLTSAGVAPKNGWIADYPMTPIIIGQVQNAVIAAADAKKLPMGKDEALQAFQGLTNEFGLTVAPGSGQYAESEPPTSSPYVQPTVVNDYYYEEGPPVVTYYTPPWDYYYLYAWVPYPFWCTGFFFPGFFILNDFSVNIVVAGHFHRGDHFHHTITNHFTDTRTRGSLRVDPTTRTAGRTVGGSVSHASGVSHGPGFTSPGSRMGAVSIFNRSLQRSAAPTGTPGRGLGLDGTMSHSSFSPPGRSFSKPSGGFGSFNPPGNPPSGSFSPHPMNGRSSFSGPQSLGSFPSSHSFSGGGFGGSHVGSLSGGFHSSGGLSGGSHGGGGFSGGFHGGGGFRR